MYSLSAPTRGATRAGSAAYAGRAISTRAPTRGATAKTDNKSSIFAPNISTISKTLGSVN